MLSRGLELDEDDRGDVLKRVDWCAANLHVSLPEPADLVTIDVAWTRQRNILPNARKLLQRTGTVVTLIKPHYEAEATHLRGGVLLESEISAVLERVKQDAMDSGFEWLSVTTSPIKGAKGNIEMLAHLRQSEHIQK